MAQGIGLAGGFGAGGVRDALVDLIVQKQVAEDRAIAARQRALQEQRQAMLDAQAAEDRTFTRTRLAKGDARAERLDAEAREDKNAKQAIELATLFPGKVVSGETMKRVPKYLHELIATPKDEQLASRSIGGMAVAGDPNAGEIEITEHEAVAPNSYELQLPVSERKRIADERAATAADKADRDAAFRDRQQEERERHNQTIEAIRASGAGRSGTGPLVRVTYTDPETGQTFEQDMTRDEARALGPRAKPMAPKDLEAGAAMSDYVKKIDDALALGEKSEWAGTGVVEGRVTGMLGGKFASEDALALRGLIADLFAENAHERFGGALTAQEIARAKGYLAEASDDPKKIKSNLQRMKAVVAPALERWQARKGGGAPSGDPGAGQQFDFDPQTGKLVPRGGR